MGSDSRPAAVHGPCAAYKDIVYDIWLEQAAFGNRAPNIVALGGVAAAACLSAPRGPRILARERDRISSNGRLRPRHHRRRHQRNRHRPRRRRPRLARAAGRDERPRLRHLLGLLQDDPWRLALSGARRLPAGARGAHRARSAARHGAASDPPDALSAAAGAGRAQRAAAALRAFALRLAGRAQAAAGRRRRSISPIIRWPRRSCARSATASNIPIAWSTIPAWSCSTRSTPPSAAPSSAPARGLCARRAGPNGSWCSTVTAAARWRRRARSSMPPAPGSTRWPTP